MVAVFIIGVIIYLYLRVRRVARTFTSSRQGTSGPRASSSGGRASSSSSGRQSSSGRSSASNDRGSYSSQQSNNDSGSFVNEELYDQRSDREINRKIFSKDEGEYVEFEEVK